jgi:hypothetical protein
VPDGAQTLGELAELIRSKNAGPFWVTLDVFLPDRDAYDMAAAPGLITPDAIGRLYDVAPETVEIFRIPDLRVIKVSFPRAVAQASLLDRDMHAGQQHVPLASLSLNGGAGVPLGRS